LPTAEQRLPGLQLLHCLEEAEITHVTLPPTALAALPQKELPKLTSLVVAGEPCPPKLAADWSKGRLLFNGYGPTEITVCASIAELAHADIDVAVPLPIGRPLANTRLYVLDCHLQPVPLGMSGELHIGGAGLARGYLNRPELTVEKFIPDPFSSVPGARL
ncbi:MAG: AMP-binding protein, partial [Deltaproteobacteria bacterium]